MNVLLLDIGNTCLKWLVPDINRHRLGVMTSCSYAGETVVSFLDQQWSALEGIDRVVIAAVGNHGFVKALEAYVQQRWGLCPDYLRAQAKGYAVINGYTNPAQLGIDRWLALIAARQLVTGPVWVIDCGTTVTIDRLEATGQHQGGLILPGLVMMMQSLDGGTEQLSCMLKPDGPGGSIKLEVLGKDTTTAITTGVLLALVAVIDRLCHAADPTVDSSSIIITGGDSDLISPLLAAKCLHYPQLVLQGAALMAGISVTIDKAEEIE